MSKVNIINNAKKDLDIVVNQGEDKIEIVVNLANDNLRLSSTLKAGDIFKDKDGDEYILWYYLPNGNAVIIKKTPLIEMKFGSNNNYNGSDVDNYLCDKYLPELEKKFGKHNIVEHEVDLFSLDGEDDYGKITRRVSVSTLDEYRYNKKVIKNHINKWFWLCTPNSTPSGYGSSRVRGVNSDGRVDCGWCSYFGAVRPRFVLNSSIFESTEGK